MRRNSYIKFQITMPFEIYPDEHMAGVFVSRCPSLDIYSQGDSEDESLGNLKEAVQLFIETCYERGSLEQVLKDCGFEAKRQSQREQIANINELSIPLSLVSQRGHGLAQTA